MTQDPLAATPTSAKIHLKFLDVRLTIETNSLAAAKRLEAYFLPHLTAPARGKHTVLRVIRGEPRYEASRLRMWSPAKATVRGPKESYYDRGRTRYILKNRTGMLITLGDAGASIAGNVDKHLNQVVNLVSTLFGIALAERGYAMVHASAVARTDRDDVMIFMGNSGSGKSSLALYLIEHGGFDYISNDRVMLKAGRDGVHVIGLPKKPRVNPGTLLASTRLSRLLRPSKRGLYEQMHPEELWGVEDKHDVDVRRALGAMERLDGRLAGCLSLEWRPDGRGRETRDLDAPGALAALLSVKKDFGPFDRDAGRRLQDVEAEFRRLAQTVVVSRVTGRADPAGLAREWPRPRARRRSRASAR